MHGGGGAAKICSCQRAPEQCSEFDEFTVHTDKKEISFSLQGGDVKNNYTFQGGL